jgi:asparagine synthase (glutamine-hydrolysing)
MCGIAGVVDFMQPMGAHVERVRAMRARLRHRGPDGEGEHVGEDVVLGHTRLAVLDIEGGVQPMTRGRFTIVYNGELANAVELRDACADHSFRTRSDTEVVLAAYLRWGDACVERLSGMFAFFVWDHERRRGFAARDRLGVKPLFFAQEEGAFVFASEAHAIARTRGTLVRPNVDAIVDVMTAPCFSGVDRAMFEGVTPLLPGHLAVIDRDGVRLRRWWRWPVDASRDVLDEPTRAIPLLRDELLEAARRALAADVPIGVFASGGLDSTILSAVLAAEARPGSPRAAGYTVTFDDQARFDYGRSAITGSDDTPFARAAARELGLEERLVHVARAEIARDIERVAIANDALPAWEQEIAQHRLATAAHRDGTKVVLVGDAADETHYGYHFLLDRAALAGPHVILERLGGVPIRPEISADPRGAAVRALVAHVEEAGGTFEGDDASRLAATTLLVVERWLPRLLHNGDVHTMRASVEARVPFADARLVDLAARISPRLALHGGVEKWALREAARGLVPETIRTRRKSALPKDLEVEPVLRAELARVVVEPPELVRSIVDLDAMRAFVESSSPLTEGQRAAAFRVVAFAHWTRHHGVVAP